jgi:hypothetical protein
MHDGGGGGGGSFGPVGGGHHGGFSDAGGFGAGHHHHPPAQVNPADPGYQQQSDLQGQFPGAGRQSVVRVQRTLQLVLRIVMFAFLALVAYFILREFAH